ncbi:PREDICTED: zinc finger protein 90-like [Gekko japonicus]|uniref:Zinc finger protein 90-like n=1 Tax=Gekko japonicus TaxID=146911 RepID=A0ABM1KWI8_GEKJA|nr:PREDICTED: zinc finger protein 90-like [Gekko japonicus]
MATELLVEGLSFQAQLEHNIEREETQVSLHGGKVERAVLLDELLELGLQAVKKEQTKRVTLQNWEVQQPKVLQTPITPAWNNLQPPLLTPQDDIEVYLDTFERVAEACQWPREEWVTRLAPALNGSIERITSALGAYNVKDYETLKEAILKTYNITAETWRQRFRQFCYPEAKGPLEELATNSHEKEPDASGPGQSTAYQESGQEREADSSLQNAGMIPSEKRLQSPLKDETEELQRNVPAIHMADPVQNCSQGRMWASQVRTTNDLINFPSTMDKNISAAYHDTGHHKIQGIGVGTEGKLNITRQHAKSFGRQTELLRDKRMHNGEKSYQCPKCRRRFSESTALHQHLKSHTAEKRYQCTECEMRFRQSSDLIKHQRIHTGEKPYQCQECGKRFSLCSALYRHCRGHSGVKPFQCKECGKSFTRNSSLAQHHRLHKQ